MSITVKNLSVTYKDSGQSRRILQHINLSLKAGSFVSILGHNGSGKSTLLRTIAGFQPSYKGTISLNNTPLNTLKAHQRSMHIGYVQQNTNLGTAGQRSVLENMCLSFPKKWWFSRPFHKKNRIQAERILKKAPLNLLAHRHSPVRVLSGGQKQLLALLMVLEKNVPCLLLDEITAALDPKTADIVMQRTAQAVKEQNITTLSVTHDLSNALTYSDRIIILHEGHIIQDFSKEECAGMNAKTLAQYVVH